MTSELPCRLFERLLRLWLPAALATAVLIAAAGAVFKYSETDFRSNAEKTTAKIIGVTNHGYPVLSYTVGGKTYRVQARSLIPGAGTGSTFEIEYHKRNPANVQTGENPIYQISSRMIVLGTLGALVLSVLLLRRISHAKKQPR